MDNSLKKKYEGYDLGGFKSPFQVAFDVTAKCNFRCRHCYNNSGDCLSDELTDEELLGVAKQLSEMQPTGICLCGGEPLLRGEIIFEVIQILTKSCGNVNIVSNGWIITEEICKRLKECGINTLQISVDGATAFQHENMRLIEGSFERAKNAIQCGVKAGLRVVASYCPNKLTYKSFPDVAKLTYELGASEVRSMPLVLMGRGSQMESLQLSAKEYLEFQQIVFNTRKDYADKGFGIEWGDPLDHLTRMPNNEKMGFNSFSMEIRADGKLLLTSYLPIVVGDVRKHSLKEYWEAGYNRIWSNPKIEKYIDGIYSTKQFGDFKPQAYSGEDIVIDLIDGGKR